VVNLAEMGLDELFNADESIMAEYVDSWEAWRRQ
jgi:hypothetical protein